jgi:thiosulfate/3-mercaptopyruvate sulfurtransferase
MTEQRAYANEAALVSTDWVAARLDDPGLRLLEVDVDTAAYERGHVPGAVGVNWRTQLGDPVRRDVPDRDSWERLLGQAGVARDTRLVFYGDNSNWFAAYAYWLATMYGHPATAPMALMNGGRTKWEAEGRPMTTEAPRIPPTAYRAADLDQRYRALMPDVHNALAAAGAPAGAALVDVRSPAEFQGEIIAPPGLPETAQRAGHIPGALNVPWGQAVQEDGTFKAADELRRLYAGRGVTPERPVIAYCRIGERSSHTWFVLKELLGYPDVRNYDGSWTEWGSVIGAPIDNPAAGARR